MTIEKYIKMLKIMDLILKNIVRKQLDFLEQNINKNIKKLLNLKINLIKINEMIKIYSKSNKIIHINNNNLNSISIKVKIIYNLTNKPMIIIFSHYLKKVLIFFHVQLFIILK